MKGNCHMQQETENFSCNRFHCLALSYLRGTRSRKTCPDNDDDGKKKKKHDDTGTSTDWYPK